MLANDDNLSTKDYLELLAAKITAETKNAVNEGIKDAMDRHQAEHEKFMEEDFKPLRQKVHDVRRWRDWALIASLVGHGKTVTDLIKMLPH